MSTRFHLNDLAGLSSLEADTIIDVRSPAEFEDDHLPGAISLPVLSDAERAEVGTIYKQESPFKARKIGGALIAKNVAAHIQTALADKPHDWRPFVYCWRGGQRSGAMAIVLEQIGWRVQVLDGGYKAYRRKVVDFCQSDAVPHPLILLDGNTGTAKTDVLALLQERGHQVVDLEGLANHRGSVFGAMGTGQPSQRAFESAVAVGFAGLDPSKPVLLEAESAKIGARHIPATLWTAMQAAPRLRLTAPVEERAAYLVRAYGEQVRARDQFSQILDALVPIQGKERIAAWQDLLGEGQLAHLAEALIFHHYDPRYAKSRDKHSDGKATSVHLSDLTEAGLHASLPEVEQALAAL